MFSDPKSERMISASITKRWETIDEKQALV